MPVRSRFLHAGVWPCQHMQGVTLLELMVVVTIIGIIVAIAYPSYERQIQQTRRSDGKVALLETVQRLERCYTRFNSYTNGGCTIAPTLTGVGFDSTEGWYHVTGAVTQTTFAVTATPQRAQNADTRCGNLTIGNTGARTASGTQPDSCW